MNISSETELFRKIASTPMYIIIAVIFVILLAAGAGIYFGLFLVNESGRDPDEYVGEGKIFTLGDYEVRSIDKFTVDEYLEETDELEVLHQLNLKEGYLFRELQMTLTWRDEPDDIENFVTQTNEPDAFSMCAMWKGVSEGNQRILAERQFSVENMHGEEGLSKLSIQAYHDSDRSVVGDGQWNFTVYMSYAGDYYANPKLPPMKEDKGNDFHLEVEFFAYVPRN